MNPKYLTNLKDAIKSFWTTRSSVGVLPGKQLDEFLKLIKQVARMQESLSHAFLPRTTTYQAIIVQAKTGI